MWSRNSGISGIPSKIFFYKDFVISLGVWRSLVAHLHGVQGVVSSSPTTPTNSRKGDNESCLLFLCIRLRQLNKNNSLRHNTRVVFASNSLRKACHYLRIYATIITTNERENFNFSPNITEFFVVIIVFFI